jgi:hypothetical protein
MPRGFLLTFLGRGRVMFLGFGADAFQLEMRAWPGAWENRRLPLPVFFPHAKALSGF